MTCPRCGASATGQKRFCGDCGAPLPWLCSSCGAENPPGKRFCADCGVASGPPQAAAPPAAAAPEAERRQVSVMFVDLVGSTALSAELDPEDLREVAEAYRTCVESVVVHYGGIVARYSGDGVLAYFGYPQARENDAEEAVRAALGIVEAVPRLATVAGPPGTLRVRIGIATGIVVVGDLIGSGASREVSTVGETANLASRLQGLAEPGRILISDATRDLTRRLFRYGELPPTMLKGLPRPVRPWLVLGESAIESRFEALRSDALQMVGRAEELDLLRRRWARARAGEGCVALIVGEPGIGKSRLFAALEREVRGEPCVRLRLMCLPTHQDEALHPVIRHFERAAGIERGDPPDLRRAKLLQAVLVAGPEAAADFEAFAELAAVPGAADAPPRQQAASPAQRREMTFGAVLRQIERLGRQAPVLAVLEDLHWADPTTLDLLDRVVEASERLRMLLVVTMRPDLRPAWTAHPQVTTLLLTGLGRRQAAELVAEVAGDRALPPEVLDGILARADGVPLFLEELTRTVLEGGLGGGDERAATAAPQQQQRADPLPASLQGSLMARLDRLSAAKEVAQVGAVIGREFSLDTLQSVSRQPVEALTRALAELSDAGLIVMRRRQAPASYAFKHVLVQEAAYTSLLRDRRRLIHLKLAELLEQDAAAAAAEPSLLAWHLAEAGAPERAVAWYLRAAELASGRSALAERASHLRKGLGQVAALPEGVERRRRELGLQLALGQTLIDHLGSGSDEVRGAFERGRELALSLGDTTAMLRVHDGLVANHHFTRCDWDRVFLYAEEMAELGRRGGNEQATILALRSSGLARLLLGRLAEARRDMEAMLALYRVERDGPHAALSTRDQKVSICTALGLCLSVMGEPGRGAAAALEGVRHADAIGHAVSLILGLRRACVEGMARRDVPRVRALSERLLAVDARHATYLGRREGLLFEGWARLAEGPDPETVRRLEANLQELDAHGHWVLLPFFLACFAEVRGEGGDREGAAAVIDRAAGLTRVTRERWSEAEILRIRARFAARDAAEADALLEESIAVAREQGALLWELRAATARARLLHARGRRTEARDALAPVVARFGDSRDAPDVAAARAVLARAMRRSAPPPGPAT